MLKIHTSKQDCALTTQFVREVSDPTSQIVACALPGAPAGGLTSRKKEVHK